MGWKFFFLLLILFFDSKGDDKIINHRPELAAASVSTKSMFRVGEELEYKVSYAFLNLGTIKIQVLENRDQKGKSTFLTRAYMDSNPALRWLVDLHVIFESVIDKDVYSHSFLTIDSTSHEVVRRFVQFDYDGKRALFDLSKRTASRTYGNSQVDTARISTYVQDGLSLLFYAREHLRQSKRVTIPTIIDNGEVSTFINFMNKKTSTEIDAIDYEVDVVEFNGRAEYVGIFGMTGGFRGWFSNDDARVPIRASMNVILGSVKIELIRWKRPGWTPPKYEERKKL